jgi:hypothetical protein
LIAVRPCLFNVKVLLANVALLTKLFVSVGMAQTPSPLRKLEEDGEPEATIFAIYTSGASSTHVLVAAFHRFIFIY